MSNKSDLDMQGHLVAVGKIAKALQNAYLSERRKVEFEILEGIEAKLTVYPKGSIENIANAKQPSGLVYVSFHNKGGYSVKFTDIEGHKLEDIE